MGLILAPKVQNFRLRQQLSLTCFGHKALKACQGKLLTWTTFLYHFRLGKRVFVGEFETEIIIIFQRSVTIAVISTLRVK